MTTNSHIKTACGLAVVLGFGLLAPRADAQEFHRYGYNHGYQVRPVQVQHVDILGRYVLALDRAADQMVWQFAFEARRNCGCTRSAALLAAMRDYSACVDHLVGTYHGSCPRAFRDAACAARNALTCVKQRRKHVQVSPQVCLLIRQSCQISSYIQTNANHFRATSIHVVPQGGYSHHYDRGRCRTNSSHDSLSAILHILSHVID